jgi:hypothetical protein
VSRAWNIGAVGIAALLASSVGVISLITADGGEALERPSAAAPAFPEASAPAAPAPVAAAPAAEASEGTVPSPARTPPPVHRAPAPPNRTADNALTPATHQARISFRGQLTAGVAEMQRRVARCASNTTFNLDLETVEAGIRVLDVTPEPGISTDQEAACARSALKGKVIPPPSAEPGRRWRMPLTVRSTG